MSLLAASVPDLSEHAMAELTRLFTPLRPVPNVTTLDELMYNAGQQDMLEYIRSKFYRKQIITGSL